MKKIILFLLASSSKFSVYAENPGLEEREIKIYDSLGRIVKDFKTNQETLVIDMERAPKGIYLLKLKSKDDFQLSKVIIH